MFDSALGLLTDFQYLNSEAAYHRIIPKFLKLIKNPEIFVEYLDYFLLIMKNYLYTTAGAAQLPNLVDRGNHHSKCEKNNCVYACIFLLR